MRKLPYRLLILCSVGTALVGAIPNAHAQGLADTNPPLPNILLIVDTSGSMERKSDSQAQPTCDPTGASASEKSRWIETVEVLTGSIQDYRCQAVARNSTSFKDEYSILGNLPYDFNYVNAYHRPLSGTCTPGPGVLPTPTAYDYPVGSIKYHPYSSLNTTCNTFAQTADGILDTFGGFMRFGLMTFDTLPSKETGVNGTVANYALGIQGTWSYFLNSAAATGRPELCTTAPLDIEVGARNAAAPPWEGRMVAFGDPAADSATVLARNAKIQEILLATRPFGATPIAGVMQDAEDLLWNDTSTDPLNNALKFGPGADPFIRKGCRQQGIILLTDGEPNLDLRPACEGAGPPAGKCPYEKPETTALTLSSSTSTTQRPAKTYVVGFALSTVTVGAITKDCTAFTDDDLTGATGLCNNVANKDNVNLQACCTLNRIAFKGGTTKAYFASDKNALGSALSKILQEFATTTTRTHPAFSSAATGSDSPGFRFFSSYRPSLSQTQLPDGQLERQRYTCKDPTSLGVPKRVPVTLNAGDNFAANLNSAAADARVFLSVEVDADGAGKRWSDRSVRPSIATDVDGLASYLGTQYGDTAASFVSSTLFASLQLTSNTDDCLGLSDVTCRDRVLKWLVGLNNGSNLYDRCEIPGSKCHLMGDILHSTPALVNRPLALLRDESYQAFAGSSAKRPLTLYVSTNDGLLHAFRVASNERDSVTKAEVDPVNSLANNELWAFIPPAVLPLIQSEYPPTQVRLLDGSPVVKDVVAKKQSDGSYVFERTSADAQAGTGDWRTVLVQSFGPGAAVSGYFALDVTDPVVTSSSKPKFLWQLTVAGDNSKLFGPGTAKPLITTVFYDGDGDGKPEEVPVAVLPGGDGVSAGTCARAASATNIDTNFPARTTVNCYPSPQAGRSLTIVRLDTGKIIRTFRRDATDAPAALTTSGVVIPANLDAPIVGEPVAFPSKTGAVADRIFVGDKEGGLWKIDLASTDPDAWTMKLFFDGFPGGALSHVAADGKPVSTPPILSVDDLGNVTVAFSTGDQEVFTYAAGVKNYVWSLTEKFNGSALESKVNWYQTFDNGERVTGPLSLFNRNFFFSSFLPDDGAGGECALGKAYVWGMDYLVADPNNAAGSGGRDALQTSKGPPAVIADKLDVSTTLTSSTRTSIFGVGVAQEPTCFDEVTASSQDSLGFGSHTSVKNVNPGKFQLVVQTGAGGEKVEGGSTNALTIDLPPPALRSVIDSWAAIVE